MTIEQISAALRSTLPAVANRIQFVAAEYGGYSLERIDALRERGGMSDDDWIAYKYLWRNNAVRYSTTLSAYSLTS